MADRARRCAILSAFLPAALAAAAADARPLELCAGAAGAESAMRAIIAADNARDLGAVVAHYTRDVRWLPANRAPTLGLDAVRAAYVHMYDTFLPDLGIVIGSVRVKGMRARMNGFTRGRLRPVRTGDGEVVVDDRFRASLVCRRGRWLVEELAWGPAG
jgi:ketosteroid isomerase-like protein